MAVQLASASSYNVLLCRDERTAGVLIGVVKAAHPKVQLLCASTAGPMARY